MSASRNTKEEVSTNPACGWRPGDELVENRRCFWIEVLVEQRSRRIQPCSDILRFVFLSLARKCCSTTFDGLAVNVPDSDRGNLARMGHSVLHQSTVASVWVAQGVRLFGAGTCLSPKEQMHALAAHCTAPEIEFPLVGC
jgi:hypothetical protein